MTHRITVWLRTGIYWQAKRRFGRAAVTQMRKYSKFLIPLYRHVVYRQVYCLSLSIVQLELFIIDYTLYIRLAEQIVNCIWIEEADCPFTISRLRIGLKPT